MVQNITMQKRNKYGCRILQHISIVLDVEQEDKNIERNETGV